MADKNTGLKGVLDELPVDRLKDEIRSGLGMLGEKAVESAGQRLTDLTGRLTDVADGGGVVGKAAKKAAKEGATGGSPVKGALVGGLGGVKDKVKEKIGGGGGNKGGKGTRSTSIIEEIDIGAPISLVYNQWTQFQDWSGFMKKVKGVDQQEDEKVEFSAQVFWSHRKWQGTIIEQVPDEKIVWRSQGEKGHVDGAVTFHEITPDLTRVLVVLEYYPQGLFERTGNLWRAQGRRARLELKHFRRHVMVSLLQGDTDEVEGWRGEIHDSEVVRSHEEVVEEEQQAEDESPDEEYDESEEGDGEPEDEYAEEQPEDEYAEEEPEDEEYAEEEPEDEYAEEEPEDEEYAEEEPEDEEYAEDEPEDEYVEDEEYAEEEPEDEEEPEEEPEEKPRRRRRAR
ncbi:SRPBCC family protein [Nocardioides iriomotensis]|uniref:SRPBCC family protein n=1 Tax=Nocardioides iriomotensis TaxID=715784 RepID=A0A4Q5IX85_9ACTN|nr:SRPBCC family protein [Nocardioides iriomotensis]RYU10674.1 SRPBCC family protein [Nocardioides iriomotensis]